MRQIIYSLLFLCACATSAFAANVNIEVSGSGDRETLTMGGITEKPSKVFTLDNPPRLVVDVPSASAAPTVSLKNKVKKSHISKARSGRFNPTTARIVVEMSKVPATIEQRTEDGEVRLILNFSGAATKAAEVKEVKDSRIVVIIDAGHGGEDPGTIGPSGTQEKDVTLGIAKALAKAFDETGKYKAILTRNGDYFIKLRERIQYAKRNKGEIFISLHADSAPERNVRGLSIYNLSDQASDAEAEALAARENRADIVAGVDLNVEDKDVANILISLAQRETNNQSTSLASAIVKAMDGQDVRLLENPHRSAGFAVLKSPDIPSVLIETGFLSSRDEESLLNSNKYRDKLIDGIVSGVDGYVRKRGN